MNRAHCVALEINYFHKVIIPTLPITHYTY